MKINLVPYLYVIIIIIIIISSSIVVSIIVIVIIVIITIISNHPYYNYEKHRCDITCVLTHSHLGSQLDPLHRRTQGASDSTRDPDYNEDYEGWLLRSPDWWEKS